MADVVALGEVLIDFTSLPSDGYPVFEANPGGAPCNVLSAVCRLGHTGAILGKVGMDSFGILLKETLDRVGVDTSWLAMTPDYFTTLAFVSLDKQGDRSFTFSRKHSADIMLDVEDVSDALLQQARIFQCGTLSLTHEKSRRATLYALQKARSYGLLISVDPNLRENLWPDALAARNAMFLVMEYADILKISDYEVSFLYPDVDCETACTLIKQTCPFLKLLIVTKGRDGASLFFQDTWYSSPSFLEVETIDTTGAGDAFCGAVLAFLLDRKGGVESLDESSCRELLLFANAAASLSTTRRGAIEAMPSRSEVLGLLSSH